MVCKGRLVKVHLLKLLLHKELVGSARHAPPTGRPLGCDWLGPHGWRRGNGIQMSNSLFGPLVGELPSHLHIMTCHLESSLQGYDIYHVAGPGVYAHQLVGVVK